MGVRHITIVCVLLQLLTKPFSFSSHCNGTYWQRIIVTDTACDRGGCQYEHELQNTYHLKCCNFIDAVNHTQNGTIITIEKNDTLSDTPVNVSDISNLCIECNIDSCTIQCDNGSGTFLVFSRTNELILSNIIINGCGILDKNYAAVLIRNSNNVTIQNVKIINSTNLGLDLFNVAGNVLINACVFSMNRPTFPIKVSHNLRSSLSSYTLKHNSVEQDAKKYYGGGMFIYINKSHTYAIYTLENCKFTHNLKLHVPRNKKHFAGDHGGGLYVYFDYHVSSVTLMIVGCHFIGNSAGLGGGATIRLSHYVNNTATSIRNCEFHNNTARNFSISNGGGLQIAFSPSHGHNNNITIEGCNFTGNDAFFGGGMSLYSSFQAIKDDHHLNNVKITNSKWSNNTATSGAAVDVSQHFIDDLTNKKNLIKPIFKDCSFRENTIKLSNTAGRDINGNIINVRRERNMLQESVGNGIMSVNLMNVVFNGEVSFSSNTGSALTATKSIIYIDPQCNLTFSNNTGINGGAISLEGFASLLVSPNVTILFEENHALNHGGAIYSVIINDHMLFTKAACPINFKNAPHDIDPSVHIEFIHNTAKTSGHSIYLSSLLPCQIAYSGYVSNIIGPNNTFNKSCFDFVESNSTDQIATAPSNYKYKNMSMKSNAININVNPGEPYYLQLHLQDDLGKTVNETLFQAFVDNFKHSSLFISESNRYISKNYIIVKGPEDNTAQVLLQTVKKPLLNILLNVTTNHCPAGYKYNSTSKICDCKASNYFGIKSCAPIHKGSDETYICKSTWAGYIKGKNGKKEFVTAPCYWFCSFNHSYSVMVKLPQHKFGDNSFLYNFICSSKRTGILCGKCKDGHTAYYHDLHFYCGPVKHCQLGWLFFLLTEILPMTVIFMLITIIGFNITSGRVQGFILFSHILVSLSITSHGTINVSTSIHTMVQYFLRLFYYPLELKFFYSYHTSYCLLKKANSLEMVTFRYVNTFYALALIFVVVAFLKCFTGHCRGCSKWVRFTTAKASVLHGLAALLVLSFTTCVETSLLLLQPSPIYGENFTTLSHRVALYGDMIYLSKEHLKYAIPAFISLVLISVPVFMLLFYPLVTQLLSYFHLDADHTLMGFLLSKCFMYTRFKPFYDMFYAPFKDEHRYFAGLYLLYRALIQLPYFFSADVERYIIIELMLIAFVLVHGIIQPYQKKAHNFIDGLLLGNLVLINGLSCINIITENMKASHYWKINIAAFFQMLLIYIPMTIVIFYIIYYIFIQSLKCLIRHSHKRDYQELSHSNSCSNLEHSRQAQVSLQNSISN